MNRITEHLAHEWGISFEETEGIIRPYRDFIDLEED